MTERLKVMPCFDSQDASLVAVGKLLDVVGLLGPLAHKRDCCNIALAMLPPPAAAAVTCMGLPPSLEVLFGTAAATAVSSLEPLQAVCLTHLTWFSIAVAAGSLWLPSHSTV
jgi:hypothetical protein